MNVQETITTLPSSDLRPAMLVARTQGLSDIREGHMDRAALWTCLYEHLADERDRRKDGRAKVNGEAGQLRRALRERWCQE